MTRALLFVPLVWLTTCALPQQGELVSACQFYVTVATLTAAVPGAASILAVVDPVCRQVLAGGAAPSGIDAAYIRARTVELERLSQLGR